MFNAQNNSSTTSPPHETARPTSSSWTPTALLRGSTVYRADQKDKTCQTEAWLIPSPRPLNEYVDREVPVSTAEPDGCTRPPWVSESLEHFHTLDYCWGLRNVSSRRLAFRTLCHDNFGRNKYPDRATGKAIHLMLNCF